MIKNKVIIVTGGGGVIGQEIVEEIIKNEGIPIIADISKEKSKIVIKNLKRKYPNCIIDYVYFDISKKDLIIKAIETISTKYSKIDCLINNAYPRNKNYGREFEKVEYHDFCENVNLHLGGYFNTMQSFSEFFKKQKFGNIVNISSIYGVIAPRFEIYKNTEMTMPVEYAAIKSAIIHLTKYVAKYYRGYNIRVNSLSVGGIFDNQPKSFLTSYKNYALNKGMLDSNDIVGALLFLISDRSKYINGQNIIIDDGWSL